MILFDYYLLIRKNVVIVFLYIIWNKGNNLANNKYQFSSEDISRIIEMAWEDRTPFEAIEYNYGINESSVIKLMRSNVTLSSFKLWRKRVSNRSTKHLSKRPSGVLRAYCPTQYKNR